MQHILSLVILFGCFALVSCGSSNGSNQSVNTDGPGSTTQSGNSPVETRRPVTDFTPAFAGQTRAPGIATRTAISHRVLTNKLTRPWGIITLPDGRFLVTEKGGAMRIVTVNGEIGEAIAGLPDVNSGGQGGLLGLALDPGFSQNRMVYWTFSENVQGGTLTSVAKGRLSNDERRIENATVIYRATPAYDGVLHYGSRILFDRSGNLLVSIGERSDKEPRQQAQWLNSSLGKILRITTDGQAVSGNPFIGNRDARDEIYSFGHRNIQGMAFHPQTSELWASEMGPKGGDELNRIEPGKNYGWPIITYGVEYSGAKIGGGITQKEGMEQPVYYWDPVLSPSGMTFYTGDAVPEWQNSLFLCGLNSNHVARVTIEGNRVSGEERLLADQGQRFRAITQGNDGALYIVTDAGRLYRIGKQ